MNPQMMGMNCMVNPQMNMMPNMMMNMPRIPMTEEQKKQLRMQGYLMGKKMAEERRKSQAPKTSPVVEDKPTTVETYCKIQKRRISYNY